MNIPEKLQKGYRGIFIVQGDLVERNKLCKVYLEYVTKKIKESSIPNEYKRVHSFTSIGFCNDYANMSPEELYDKLDSIKQALVVWITVGMERDTMGTRMLFDIIFEREQKKLITILSVSNFREWIEGISFIERGIRGNLVKLAIYD